MKHFKINPKSSRPKIRQIEQHIRNQIETGKMEPGFKLPCMLDLAEQTGASIGIVRQALRTLTLEGFLRSVPKTGVFVAETLPVKNIALVLPTAELEQIPRIIRATRESLPNDYRLVIEAPSNGYEEQVELLKSITPPHISGIILLTPPMQRYVEDIHKNISADIPCVQTLAELDIPNTSSVTADGFAIGEMTVKYLISKGHKKIGLIGNESDNATFIDRKKGIDFALKTLGSSYDQMPKEQTDPTDINMDTPWLSGKKATLRLLKRHPDLTALIGGDGHITLGALQAINELDKKTPDDISLIAMELDLPAFKHTIPPLTVVDKPFEKIFHRAVEILIERIRNPNISPRSITLAPLLHDRESVKKIHPPLTSNVDKHPKVKLR